MAVKKTIKISFSDLGCPKNHAILEELLSLIKISLYRIPDLSMQITKDIMIADYIIVNTCAFLKSAREESFNMIQELVYNTNASIIVTGCISPWFDELKSIFTEEHKIFFCKSHREIINTIFHISLEPLKPKESINIDGSPYRYLRISDGCDNKCSYCLIPYIKGKLQAVDFELIIKRARIMIEQGAGELIIVGQDITGYNDKGKDLHSLVEAIGKLEGDYRIRLLYIHPDHITDRILGIYENKRVVKYFEMPIQHVSKKILRSMNRKGDYAFYKNLIRKIRSAIPNVYIHSTFIVGYPGESNKDFEILCDFINQGYIDNATIFSYSREKHTKAYYLKTQISEEEKNERRIILLDIVRHIADEKFLKYIGKTMRILSINQEQGYADFTAPDIDPIISFDKKIDSGKFYNVVIDDYYENEFFSTILK